MRKLLLVLIIIPFLSCNNNRGLVVSKIKSVAKLATTEFTINKTILATKEKKLLHIIPLNTAVFVAYTKATVKAGIDLQKLKKEEIVIKGNTISIKLPPVEVINFSYPFESFRIDKEISTSDESFWNKITITEQENLYREAELDIRDLLMQIGVVERTEANTIQLLTNLLKHLGYNEIDIEFEKSKTLFPKLDLTK